MCRSIAYHLLMLPFVSISDQQCVINWLYHEINSAHTTDMHLLLWAIWPSTLCLIICVIQHSILQCLRDQWKLTCSLLTSTLSVLDVLLRNALDKSTYLLTYLLSVNGTFRPVGKGGVIGVKPPQKSNHKFFCIYTWPAAMLQQQQQTVQTQHPTVVRLRQWSASVKTMQLTWNTVAMLL